jgi:hypothetical protein
VRRIQTRSHHQTGDTADAAGERVNDDLPAIDIDAGETNGFFVAAQREGVGAENRLVQDEGAKRWRPGT